MQEKEKIIPMCVECLCYEKTGVNARTLEEEGVCHRYPPQIVSVSVKTLQGMSLQPGAMFPQVGAAWWCAEFRPKPVIEAA